MTITGIRPVKKGLALLYIDGEAAMRLDREVLLLERIREGTALSDQELRELIEKSDARRAREKALYLLERRSHSKKELTDKIATVAPREAAAKAAEHMEELGLVNDEEFAHMYARELFFRKKLGSRRVGQELTQKGIDKETIETVINAYGDKQEESAAALLAKKYSLWPEDEKVKRRAIAALQRMGYSWDQIRAAMNMDMMESV